MPRDKQIERHELSALFGDMTELEFSELKNDIDQNGFAQPVIYTYESKILDGWHRYQVAIELDKVSELKFTALDGIQNPLGFAMGVNYFRRHMNASHRAVVKALAHESEWLQLGDNQHLQGVQDCTPKSSAKMAAEVQVSKRTMDAAKKVVKLGLTDEVIKHKKSVDEVLKEQDRVKLCYIEPDTLHHYEINRTIPVSKIQERLHTIFCLQGDHSQYAFYIEKSDKSTEKVNCEQCFDIGDANGAGSLAMLTHLKEVTKILSSFEKDPEKKPILSGKSRSLDKLREIELAAGLFKMRLEHSLETDIGGYPCQPKRNLRGNPIAFHQR